MAFVTLVHRNFIYGLTRRVVFIDRKQYPNFFLSLSVRLSIVKLPFQLQKEHQKNLGLNRQFYPTKALLSPSGLGVLWQGGITFSAATL